MNKKEFSCTTQHPVVLKAGKKTITYVDYNLKMGDRAVEGRGWGVANKSDTDEYNKEFGIALAKTRAKMDALIEIEKKLVKYSKKFCIPPAFENWGYQPRHMTATEVMMKDRNELYPNPWPDSVIEDMEELNANRNKITSERMDAKRKKADPYTYDVGEEITKIEHLRDYLVVSTKTRVVLFTMEDDVLIKKGEIKI